MRKFCSLIIIMLLCGNPVFAANPPPLKVVTSFSILSDMVKSVGGNQVDVTSLVGPDMDAHTYQPTPDDAKKVAQADLIFINGLGFEGWMTRLIEASGTKAKVITVTDGMKSRIMYSIKGVPDPHAWQNLTNGRMYVRSIANALEEAYPSGAKQIEARTKSYDVLLETTDRSIRKQFSEIPVEKKRVITSHDAFGYFGAAYGIEFISPLGKNDDSEPSAAQVAQIINKIKQSGIKVIFLENMVNKSLLQQIATDSGTNIGGILYSDALSDHNGPANAYISMFHSNVNLLTKAMRTN